MTGYGAVENIENVENEIVECQEWETEAAEGQPLVPSRQTNEETDNAEESSQSVCVALFTVVISIPALIGMWCWPALVIPLLGGTVTSASRHVSHFLNLGIDVVMLGGVTAYVFYEARTKRRHQVPKNDRNQCHRHCAVYGPTCLVAVASVLILADPLRHVLQDLHVWKANMYVHGCPDRALQLPERACSVPQDCGMHDCGEGYYSVNPGEDCFTCWADGMCSEGAETFRCLSGIGWVVTVICTYVGFAIFFVGVLWNSKLIPKIVRKWKLLRLKMASQ